jgi:hypothetical protein
MAAVGIEVEGLAVIEGDELVDGGPDRVGLGHRLGGLGEEVAGQHQQRPLGAQAGDVGVAGHVEATVGALAAW